MARAVMLGLLISPASLSEGVDGSRGAGSNCRISRISPIRAKPAPLAAWLAGACTSTTDRPAAQAASARPSASESPIARQPAAKPVLSRDMTFPPICLPAAPYFCRNAINFKSSGGISPAGSAPAGDGSAGGPNGRRVGRRPVVLERGEIAQQQVDLVQDRADLGEFAMQVADGGVLAGIAPVLGDDAGAGAET